MDSTSARRSADADAAYVGRFAPSPTGPLHFGSLLAAVASYLEARQRRGHWLLRIENIDPPREQPGADQLILRALEAYGFEHDGAVVYQADSQAAHHDAIDRLLDHGLAYPCGCSRRDLQSEDSGPLGTIYPGTCRNGTKARETAIRVRTDDEPIGIDDRLQGRFEQRLESESGDFIVLRRDGLVAYQLAVIVDDARQGVTEIVRGIDLLDSTPRQVYLQRLLSLPAPDYAHIPVAVAADGEKLSKATGATALDLAEGPVNLVRALDALRQAPPAGLASGRVDDVWAWAIENWRIERLRNHRHIAVQHYC